ncbi:MAG: hypothetical protein OEM24_10745 [Paracoccaceae bacterium]|nr:hypothetical protein [Paracoccaceae bacterium]
MAAVQRGGSVEHRSPLLQPGERIVWCGRTVAVRTIRPWHLVLFLAGLALMIYCLSSILDFVAANRAFRGTAFEGFMLRPTSEMLTQGIYAFLGLLLALLLPRHLWLAAGTRYYLSERCAFERTPGLLGPRHIAATIAPSGEVAVQQTGRSYSLVFSAFTTTAVETFPFVFRNLSEPEFRQALAHIRAATGRGAAEVVGTTAEETV